MNKDKLELIELDNCPLCGNDNLSYKFQVMGHGDFNSIFYKCNNCFLVFLNPKPSELWLDNFYNNVYYSEEHRKKMGWDEDLTKINMNNLLNYEKRMNFIEEHKSAGIGGKILDIGCSTGLFLYEANLRYWQVEGIEISDKAASIGRNALNLNIKTGVLEDSDYEEEYFDVVTAWDVIEHVSNIDSLMKNINRVLKQDGIFVLNTPNIRSSSAQLSGKTWRHLDAPLHVMLYDFYSIRVLLSKYGFECIKTTSGDEYLGQMNVIARKK